MTYRNCGVMNVYLVHIFTILCRFYTVNDPNLEHSWSAHWLKELHGTIQKKNKPLRTWNIADYFILNLERTALWSVGQVPGGKMNLSLDCSTSLSALSHCYHNWDSGNL